MSSTTLHTKTYAPGARSTVRDPLPGCHAGHLANDAHSGASLVDAPHGGRRKCARIEVRPQHDQLVDVLRTRVVDPEGDLAGRHRGSGRDDRPFLQGHVDRGGRRRRGQPARPAIAARAGMTKRDRRRGSPSMPVSLVRGPSLIRSAAPTAAPRRLWTARPRRSRRPGDPWTPRKGTEVRCVLASE